MKYIEADKLIALLKQRKKQLAQWTDKEYANQRIDEIDCILDADITSLQQERPEVDFEVDLEEEIDRFLKSEESTTYENAGSYKVAVKDPKKIARHFYELGLKARKEE